MIAPTAIIRGVGRTFDMTLFDDVEGMTGYYDSNLDGKLERAAREIIANENGYELGFVHCKAVDDAGHDKDVNIKVEQLEKCDRALRKFVNMLGEQSDFDTILCVTGDHTTPCKYGDHTFEPVPIVMGRVSKIYEHLNSQRDATHTYDEMVCGDPKQSALGRF